MARPTIDALQSANLILRSKIAKVEDYLQEVDPNDWCVDKEGIIDQVAELLDIDVSRYQDIEWNITVRGKVKVVKDSDPSDLDLTVRGLTVACGNMGVDGHDYDDMEIEVNEVNFV